MKSGLCGFSLVRSLSPTNAVVLLSQEFGRRSGNGGIRK